MAAAVTACGSGEPQQSSTNASTASASTASTPNPTESIAAATTAVETTTSDAPAADPATAPLLDWIAEHREGVSIVVRGGGADLAWNADQERQFASTFKTMVLAAYAREVVEGRLDPMERIPGAEVDRWLIEGTDGGSHDVAMSELADVDGSVTLDGLAIAMTAFSDNAATDALLERLGRDSVVETLRILDLPSLATSIAPTAGVLTAITDPATGTTPTERVAAFAGLDDSERDARAWAGAARFATDPTRSAETVLAALGELTAWEQQVVLAEALPWRGTAAEMADLFERAVLDERLGGDAAEIMRRHLSWPMQDPSIAARFSEVGAKDGAAAGILAVAGVARPQTGPNAGQDVIVVVSLSGLDAATWSELFGADSHQALALGLAEDPALVAALEEAVES